MHIKFKLGKRLFNSVSHALIGCLLVSLTFNSFAQQRVTIPSLDTMDGASVQLVGYWFETSLPGPQPAIVLLHGCNGIYNSKGELDQRMREYSALLNAEKWHVLVLDSFTSRGVKQLCTQKIGTRSITQQNRRRDVFGALQWLSKQQNVDSTRLVLMGWSNGGSTVLSTTNLEHKDVKSAVVKPHAAVAFYPGCEAELKRNYQPSSSLLMMIGKADDWTPPEPCIQLAQQAGNAVQLETYADAFHGFDSKSIVRLRTDVPNGVHPGQGVHIGGNDAARKASQQRMLDFLRNQLQN